VGFGLTNNFTAALEIWILGKIESGCGWGRRSPMSGWL